MFEIGLKLPPKDNMPRIKKQGKEWCLSAAEFVYFALCSCQTLYSNKDYNDFLVYRKYGNGSQDTEFLDEFFTDKSLVDKQKSGGSRIDNRCGSSKDIVRGKRKFSVIDYSVVSPMPKLKSILVSLCTDASYKIECNSINPLHVQQRAVNAYSAYFQSTFARQQSEVLGVAYVDSMIAPRTPQQLQMAIQSGHFRLKFESGFEDTIKHTLDISNWTQIEQKTIEDGMDIGFKVGKRYRCHKTGATKVKYVDPAKYVMQWNDEHEGKDPTFVGHLEKVRLYDIIDKLKEAGYSQTDIEGVASRYNSTNINYGETLNFGSRDEATGRWGFENLSVDVLEWEYITNDSVRMYKSEDGLKETPDANYKADEKYESNCIYKGCYIIGTGVVYDYGRAVNNDGSFSYFWDRIPGRSITSRCKPLLDDLMKLIVKWRSEIKNAAPSGYYMDMTAFANMSLSLGDQKELIQQSIAAHRQTGILTGQSITKQGKTVAGQPITPLANGPQNLEKYSADIMNVMMNILDTAGIPQMLAATPTQDKGKAVRIGEQEVISGNHALYLQKESVWRFKENAANSILRQVRADMLFDKSIKKYYDGVIDSDKVRAMEAVKGLSMDELTITLKALPNQIEKENLKITIREAAMAGTRDGLKTLVESDLMVINRLIDSNQLEVAEMYAANVIDQRLAEYAAKAPEADARNKAMQMEMIAAKEESDMRVLSKKIELEGLSKSNIEAQKGNILMQLQGLKGEQEIAQIHEEGIMEVATGTDIKNPRN
jgi:hypothetical protein